MLAALALWLLVRKNINMIKLIGLFAAIGWMLNVLR